METPDNFDFETFKQEAIKGLYSGKSLTGENGIFAPMLKHFLESALQGELDNHLNANKAEGIKNRKNGLSKKTIKSNGGSFELETPRDRDGSFSPQVVGKRQLVLTDTLERQIISMYSHGMSYSSINEQLEELYGYHLSVGELSNITDRIIPRLQEWQSRPLSRVYAVVWMDAMFYKVRVDGKVSSRAMYSVIGLGLDGKKEVLGIYLAETEGAKFWLSVLSDFKARGVEDILISCVDGLKGFPQAIEAVFPKTQIQLCVVHQIRYSIRFVANKHLSEFVKDLKLVYKAENLGMAEQHLGALAEKWSKLYPKAVETWTNNWDNISTYFQYSPAIRKTIYTTNTIEGYHRQIRKITKSKGAFASDNALLKLAYLAIQNMDKVWNAKISNWREMLAELMITFEDRISQVDLLS